MFIRIFTKIFISLSLLTSLLLSAGQLLAGSVSSLYDYEVAVADESADTRQLAFTQGLSELFIRISGDSDIMSKLKRPPASRYVRQFSYLPIETPEINQDGEALAHQLNIKYNGTHMQKYLLENDFSVWSEHRPDVVVWLAIRDGQNEYVLKDSDQSLLKSTMDEALARRGLPRSWPLNDYTDRNMVKVADIRGGFKDPLTKASKRYGNGPVLAGSMIWNGQQWQSSWSLQMASTEQYWSLVDNDYTKLLNTAVDTAADTMATVFAIDDSMKVQQLAALQLDVDAVDSVVRFRRLEEYLKNMTAVNTVLPVFVDGEKAVFQITLRTEEEDFLNLIKNDAELVEVLVTPVIKPQPTAPVGNEQAAETQVIQKAGTEPELRAADTTLADASAETAKVDKPDPEKIEPQLPRYYYRLIN